jgi:hypothetical protein
MVGMVTPLSDARTLADAADGGDPEIVGARLEV